MKFTIGRLSLVAIALAFIYMGVEINKDVERSKVVANEVSISYNKWKEWSKAHCKIVKKEYGVNERHGKGALIYNADTYKCDNQIEYTMSDYAQKT